MKIKQSFGVAVCRVNPSTNQYELLLVRKNNTFAFVNFILQKHSRNEHRKILSLLNRMTFDEKITISSLDFSIIWHRFQGANPRLKFPPDGFKMKREDLERFHTCNANFANTFLVDKGKLLRELIEKSFNSEPLWEIPKGRKNPDEGNLNCAIRETEEETSMTHDQYIILPDPPVKYSQQTSYVNYECTYYIAVIKDQSIKCEPVRGVKVGSFPEITDVRWMSIEAIKLIDSHPPKIAEMASSIFDTLEKKYKLRKLIKNGNFPIEL